MSEALLSKNPHMWFEALDAPGTPLDRRRWQCCWCYMVGTHDELQAQACMHVYPPCPYCGQTPECASDCEGIALAFSGEHPDLGPGTKVHVAGMFPGQKIRAPARRCR
jgi:hypothetical protein